MKALALLLPSLALLSATGAGAQERDAWQRDGGLALHRFELRPYGGWAAVPNSVTGAFVGADITFRLHPFFALGADAAWYAPFDASVPASPTYPLNETRWSADLDAYFVPWPAHARSGAAAGAFEPYLLAGLGAILTRPVSIVDPANRHFDQDNKLIDFCFGLGARLFVTEWMAVSAELRDLVYSEKTESPFALMPPTIARDPSTWYDTRAHITNAIQVRFGASFFLGGG